MGCSGGGSTNTVTQTSAPNPDFLNAYNAVQNAAQGAAQNQFQQYTGPLVAGFTPEQQQAFGTIENAQGVVQPYINQASNYLQAGASPIQSMTPGYDAGQLSAQGAANLQGGTNYDVNKYLSPYTQNVTNALQNLFNQQNATQQAQVQGNATSQNAYGGDREAVAQALTAQQEQLAQAPALANVLQQGFQQAQNESNTQQQLAMQTGAQQLSNWNALNQAQIGAQQATGWLQQGAGYGLANLGNQQQASMLTGANAELQSGSLQQQLAQQQLNIPYEQFTQQQAYPFQTIGWLGNIAEGLGAGAGGTSSTTSPGPSTLGQLAGAGVAGAGLLGQTGAFGSGGWLTNAFGSGAGAAGNADYSGGGDFFAERGGRIERGVGGASPPAPSGVMVEAGIPDVSLSVIPPGTAGGGKSPIVSSFMTPSSTSTSSGGGGNVLGDIGTVAGIANLGLKIASFLADGGSVGRDSGGPIVHVGVAPDANLAPSQLIGSPTASTQGLAWQPQFDYAPTFDAQGYPKAMTPTVGATPGSPGFSAPPMSLGVNSNGTFNRPSPGGSGGGSGSGSAPPPPPPPTADQNINASLLFQTGYGNLDSQQQQTVNNYIGMTGGSSDTNAFNQSSGGDSGGGGWRGGRFNRDDGGSLGTPFGNNLLTDINNGNGHGIPNVSIGIIPHYQANQHGGMGIPKPPPAYQGENTVQQMADISKNLGGIEKIFKSDNNESMGGGVTLGSYGQGFDDGGAAVQQSGQAMSGGQSPMTAGLLQQYLSLPEEQLQELAMRAGPSSVQEQLIHRALQMKHMGAAAPQQQSGGYSTPTSALSPGLAQVMYRGGGLYHRDDGGALETLGFVPSDNTPPVTVAPEHHDAVLSSPPPDTSAPETSILHRIMNPDVEAKDIQRTGGTYVPPPVTLPPRATLASAYNDATPDASFENSTVPSETSLATTHDVSAALARYTPAQLAAAKEHGMMMDNGLPSVPPEALNVNSKGAVYSGSLKNQPRSQIDAENASLAAGFPKDSASLNNPPGVTGQVGEQNDLNPNGGVSSSSPYTSGDFIKHFEGAALSPYNDVGHTAIGYGHDITPEEQQRGFINTPSGPVKLTGHITPEQQQAIFQADWNDHANHVAQQVQGFDKLNDNQKEALISYDYNVGHLPDGIGHAINSGNLAAAADMLRHGVATANGNFMQALADRRSAEGNLFMLPEGQHLDLGHLPSGGGGEDYVIGEGGERIPTSKTGYQVNAPSLGDTYAAKLQALEDKLINNKGIPDRHTLGNSSWLPLIAAGLGMMASRNPHALGAIGEGGLAGVKVAENQESEAAKQAVAQNEAENRNAQLQVALLGHQMTAEYQAKELYMRAQELARQNRTADAQIALDKSTELWREAEAARQNALATAPQFGNPVPTTNDKGQQVYAFPQLKGPNAGHFQVTDVPYAYKTRQGGTMALVQMYQDANPGMNGPQAYEAMKRVSANPDKYPAEIEKMVTGRANALRATWVANNANNPANIGQAAPDFTAEARQEITAGLAQTRSEMGVAAPTPAPGGAAVTAEPKSVVPLPQGASYGTLVGSLKANPDKAHIDAFNHFYGDGAAQKLLGQ